MTAAKPPEDRPNAIKQPLDWNWERITTPSDAIISKFNFSVLNTPSTRIPQHEPINNISDIDFGVNNDGIQKKIKADWKDRKETASSQQPVTNINQKHVNIKRKQTRYADTPRQRETLYNLIYWEQIRFSKADNSDACLLSLPFLFMQTPVDSNPISFYGHQTCPFRIVTASLPIHRNLVMKFNHQPMLATNFNQIWIISFYWIWIGSQFIVTRWWNSTISRQSWLLILIKFK